MIDTMSLIQVQDLTGGALKGNAWFNAVSTDTRTLQPQDLFVALRGPNFNGNQFVTQAEQAMACAALVSEDVVTALPTLKVQDTRIALGVMGAANRQRSTARVLALTGSQGKTTVKEMVAGILALCGEVLYTKGNLNNDYGVPLTLLRLAKEHQFAVIELGANAKGEIAYTAGLTKPDIALINNVAPTHLEGFGSLQGVAEAKAEIWQGLLDGGTAVINLDDDNVVRNVEVSSRIRRVTFSAAGSAAANYRVSQVHSTGLTGSTFMLHTPQGSTSIAITLPGLHNVGNALAAAAMAMEAGAGLEQVARGLADMQAAKGRLNIRQGRNGAVILDDSYNASPASFSAAIDVLATLPGKRVVVAGDMGELGSDKEAAHAALGEYARAKGIEYFFGTGALTALAVKAFGPAAVHAKDCAHLIALLLPMLASGVSVLVKGSRSAGMERVVHQLIEPQATGQPSAVNQFKANGE